MTEPKPWGANGPEDDCFAWVIWSLGCERWQLLRWDSHGGCYNMDAPVTGTIEHDAITHWLPLSHAFGVPCERVMDLRPVRR